VEAGMKYLYGASVQGIQGFIFETNKLQEIVGASEIVKKIERDFEKDYTPLVILRNAGGSIKAVFEQKEAKEIVENFPKKVMQQAYGITISQALVAMDGEFTEQDKADKEVERLLRIQRNRPTTPLDFSLGIMKFAPSTSKPVVRYSKKNEPLDRASQQKREAYSKWFNKNRAKNPKFQELKDIGAFSNEKKKIAVIHADGNGLGQIVPLLGDALSEFSVALDKATKKAFEDAKDNTMQIRDVILGGDDMIVICNANDALEFTKNFLENFEKETEQIKVIKNLKGFSKLTACAGIAYTNEKYPFHYAVDLAEALCGQAKKHSRREASCLMFHNIQSSNFQSWSKFVTDELTIVNDKEEIYCDFGAYYLESESQPTVQNLITVIESYRQEGSPISRLRAWMGELYNDATYAKTLLARVNVMAEQNSEWREDIMDKNLKNLYGSLSNEKLIVKKDSKWKTPIYDILQILSVTKAK
jgi:hypothetical protein